MALEGVGKDAADEVVQVALPQLIAEFNAALGILNQKSAQIMDLGGKIIAIADRAVAVLERVEKKLEAEGINLTLGK